ESQLGGRPPPQVTVPVRLGRGFLLRSTELTGSARAPMSPALGSSDGQRVLGTCSVLAHRKVRQCARVTQVIGATMCFFPHRGAKLPGRVGLPPPLWDPWGCAGLCLAGPTPPSSYRTAFNNNVSVAYECLSASGRKKKPGLDGRTYSELLKRICRDGEAPEEVVAPLLHKIQCRDHEAVPLDVFRAGMLTCFVLLEFVARASALYQLLEDPALAVADRCVGQAVLDTLEGALQASDAAAVPARFLEAGSRLGPDSLALAMDRALVARRPSSPMTREEFLEKAAALFIAKVKPVA
uniref:Tubulin polyglutamylase complex subunit 1 n=1 Tax=Ursus maritimus TaxID=29073 RepID=A0A452TF32_URSMA